MENAKFEIGKTYGSNYVCTNRSAKFVEFQLGGKGIALRYKVSEEGGKEFIAFTKHNGPRKTYIYRMWANPID